MFLEWGCGVNRQNRTQGDLVGGGLPPKINHIGCKPLSEGADAAALEGRF